MLLDGTFQPATVQSRLQSALGYVPDAGEYLGAHVDQAYDRTTTARVAEELGIMRAEQEDGTWDAAYAQGQDGPDSRLVTMFVDKVEGIQLSIKKSPADSPLPSARQREGYMPEGIDVLSAPGSLRGKNQLAGDVNISPDRPVVNSGTERQDGFTSSPRRKGIAEGEL